MARDLTMSSPTYDTSGQKFGTAALSGGYGQTAAAWTLSTFTWEAWVKGSTNPNAVSVLIGSDYFGFLGVDSSNHLTANVGSSFANSAVNPFDGSWHHIALSCGGGTLLLFCDGVQVGSATGVSVPAGGNLLGVRNHGSNPAFPWPGEVDEAAIWSVRLYTAAFTPNAAAYAGTEPGLWGLYHFNSAGTDGTSASPGQIYVVAPPTVSASSATTVQGSYGTTTPTALDYQYDGTGGAWSAASSPTVAGNAFSFSTTSPATGGGHTIAVRDHNNTGNLATSASFTVTGASTITVATPANALAGASVVLSGSYSGTTPTNIDVAFDGGSWTMATSPTIAGGAWSATVTFPSAGAHTLAVRMSNATGITGSSGTFVAMSAAANAAGIVYSPGNWNVTSTAATSINGGAYFKTTFAGSTCTLAFDVSQMVAVASRISYRCDDGPWTRGAVAQAVAVTIPSDTSAAATHALEVVIAATTEFVTPAGQTGQRWDAASSPNTAVKFQGLAAGTLTAQTARAKSVLVIGDSITEGYKNLNDTAATDADMSASDWGWAYLLGRELGVEVGVVGFGGQGLLAGGVGGVPAVPSSYGYLYSGVARTWGGFAAIVINEGENDGSGSTISAYTTLLNGLIAANPGVPIFAMRPFSGNQAANVQAACAACANPGIVHYVDTTGWFNTAWSVDGQHPSMSANATTLAPLLANLIRPYLAPAAVVIAARPNMFILDGDIPYAS